MAALVHGYPQQTGTVTVLQGRPSSAGGVLQSVPIQPNPTFVPGASNRSHGHSSSSVVPGAYRGVGLVQQQYGLRSLPNLSSTTQWQQARTRRGSSSSSLPTVQTLDYLQPALPALARPRYPASASMTNLPSTAVGAQAIPGVRDDSALPALGARRGSGSSRPPQSNSSSASSTPTGASTPTRPTPERYRRSAALRSDSSGSSAPATSSPQLRPSPPATQNRPNSFLGTPSGSPANDSAVSVQPQEGVKRGRRRSMPALESGFPIHLLPRDPRLPTEIARPKSADTERQHSTCLDKEERAWATPINTNVPARPPSVSPPTH